MGEMEPAPTTSAAQPKSRRRWYQYSLQTLLIFVTLAGCGFGWLGLKVRKARQQQAAVAAIQKLGGVVYYDYQFDSDAAFVGNAAPHGAEWLHSLLGDDCFRTVYQVSFVDRHGNKSVVDADLEHLNGFAKLERLDLVKTRVTDAAMEHLKGHTELGTLI